MTFLNPILKLIPEKFKNLQIKLIKLLLENKSEEQNFIISRAPWAGILNKELLDKKPLKEQCFTFVIPAKAGIHALALKS